MPPFRWNHTTPVADGEPARCVACKNGVIIPASSGWAADSETTQINAGTGPGTEQIYSAVRSRTAACGATAPAVAFAPRHSATP
jgi:hypothetical protein